MKHELTLANIKSFSLDKKPVGVDSAGRIIYQPNPRGEPYYVFDSAPGAPVGFALKVAKRKTFVVQRKVEGRTFRASLGSVAEFLQEKDGLEKARAAAAKIGTEIRVQQINPNVVARKQSAAELTLGQAFAAYREHLTTREIKRAKEATLKVFDRCVKRFEDWNDRKIRTIDIDELVERFKARQKVAATANEQEFRQAYTVVRHAIEREALAAAAARRPPLLTTNPFSIIGLEKLYRTSDMIERERREKMVRNPLTPNETLGKFLEALWAKRLSRENKTGCDYLLTTLLLGARKVECGKLRWAELLSEKERLTNSWVDLEAGKVFFYKTKNGLDHLLPLGPCLTELLRRRQVEQAEMLEDDRMTHAARKWVFPARNKASKAGHYVDAKDLLERIRDMAGIPVLTRHDLRRSFGTVLEALEAPASISKRFMNHEQAETHNRYTQAEWDRMRGWMERIEESILTKGPNVWNSLKPLHKSPLPAGELPVVPADKPRTGRPRREYLEAKMRESQVAEENAS